MQTCVAISRAFSRLIAAEHGKLTLTLHPQFQLQPTAVVNEALNDDKLLLKLQKLLVCAMHQVTNLSRMQTTSPWLYKIPSSVTATSGKSYLKAYFQMKAALLTKWDVEFGSLSDAVVAASPRTQFIAMMIMMFKIPTCYTCFCKYLSHAQKSLPIANYYASTRKQNCIRDANVHQMLKPPKTLSYPLTNNGPGVWWTQRFLKDVCLRQTVEIDPNSKMARCYACSKEMTTGFSDDYNSDSEISEESTDSESM